jgi:hypothetical protein
VLGRLRGLSLTVTASQLSTLTARSGRHRLRVALRAGRNTVRLPAWLVTAARGRRGITLTVTNRAGRTGRATLRIRT